MVRELKGIVAIYFLVALIVLSSQFKQTNAEPNMSLKTDKTIYALGEDVTIILTNNGDELVNIGGYPAWQIFTYPDDKPVYPEVFAFLAWSLAPEESNTSIWHHSQIAETGNYIVKDTQGWGLSAVFEIVNATTPEFSPNIALAAFMLLSMFVLILAKKRKKALSS